MREIQKNTGIPFSQKVEPKKEQSPSSQEQKPETDVNVPKTEDLSKSPEAVIGRSQVNQKNTIEQMKAVEGDVRDMMEKPEDIEKTNKFFDMALSFTGNYEKSAELADAFKKEFLSK